MASDPGDNSTASRQIPFAIRSPASRWSLGGTGTPPARLKATPISLADASRVPGPGQGLRISVGDPPRPFDPSVSPSTVRTIRGPQAGWEPLEDLAGRGGRTRGPRLEAIPPLLRAEGSTAGSSGRGFGEGQARPTRRSRTRVSHEARPRRVARAARPLGSGAARAAGDGPGSRDLGDRSAIAHDLSAPARMGSRYILPRERSRSPFTTAGTLCMARSPASGAASHGVPARCCFASCRTARQVPCPAG
jgi:hypothetical protein